MTFAFYTISKYILINVNCYQAAPCFYLFGEFLLKMFSIRALFGYGILFVSYSFHEECVGYLFFSIWDLKGMLVNPVILFQTHVSPVI